MSSERTSVRARTAAVYICVSDGYLHHKRIVPFVTYLLVDDSSKTSLALDDGVRDTHLAAQGRQENDELDGINIVGDKDQGGLLVLDQTNDVVETILDSIRLLADVLLLLALLDGGSLLHEALLLLRLGLGAVLVEKLEGLSGGIAVKNLLELRNCGGDLQAHAEDLLLALQTDIFGPLHHAGEVATGLDVLANAEVARTPLEERVLEGTW